VGEYTGTPLPFLAGTFADAAKLAEVYNIDVALSAAWSTWSPTLTNLTLGNGVVTARYRRIGKTLDYRFKFKLGSTSAVGTSPKFTLPATPHSSLVFTEDVFGMAHLLDSTTAERAGEARLTSGSTIEIMRYDTSNAVLATITATSPWTWATNDVLSAWGLLELA
jgi:hypothetical protein